MTKYDLSEIARVAVSAPGSMSAAVAERFDIPRRRASSWIHRARKAGHNIPLDLAKPGSCTLYDRSEVARVATAAQGSQTVAVADHFNISDTHASTLIGYARKAGYAIPRVRPRRNNPVVPHKAQMAGFALSCSCGWSCPVTAGATAIAAHTYTVHGRRPTVTERTPHTRQAAA